MIRTLRWTAFVLSVVGILFTGKLGHEERYGAALVFLAFDTVAIFAFVIGHVSIEEILLSYDRRRLHGKEHVFKMKALDGVVDGKRDTYTITVEYVQPSDPERVELSRTFRVTTTNKAGNQVRVEQLQIMQGHSDKLLYDFVAMTKKSAENDFE
jgi:hypothetical protein